MSSSSEITQAHKRIFVYSHPRTRSNVFVRLLGTHPQVTTKRYPFVLALKERFSEGLSGLGRYKEQYENQYGTTYQEGLDEIEEVFAKSNAEGKFSVIKEHSVDLFDSKFIKSQIETVCLEVPRPVIIDRMLDVDNTQPQPEMDFSFPIPNPMLLPDRIVASLSPIIIIRHPAYAFPSAIRSESPLGSGTFDPDFPINATFRWQRIIYDFYREYYSSNSETLKGRNDWPIVIDGDKLIKDPEGQMRKVCSLIGMDESLIRYDWKIGDDPELHEGPMIKDMPSFMGVLATSTGVMRELKVERNPDLDVHMRKWSEEWNDEVAKRLRKAVGDSMEDYEYLSQFSI